MQLCIYRYFLRKLPPFLYGSANSKTHESRIRVILCLWIRKWSILVESCVFHWREPLSGAYQFSPIRLGSTFFDLKKVRTWFCVHLTSGFNGSHWSTNNAVLGATTETTVSFSSNWSRIYVKPMVILRNIVYIITVSCIGKHTGVCVLSNVSFANSKTSSEPMRGAFKDQTYNFQ